MKGRLEIGLIETENLIKKSSAALINNIGKTVAIITLFVTVLITFTDISFADFGTESFATSALMLMLASYLMYFSLEDAGERLCEEGEEYKKSYGGIRKGEGKGEWRGYGRLQKILHGILKRGA